MIEKRTCRGPDLNIVDPRLARPGEIVDVEEVGTLWLWAWPALLQWPSPVTWLFSPVVGNTKWPGDLWGIDANGRLVIAETKLAPKPADPFEDFLAFERSAAFPTVVAIKERWHALLKEERRFIREQKIILQSAFDGRSTWSGVVPYSSKRYIVWRWRELYCTEISPLLEGNEYEDRVLSALAELEARGTRRPVYFGIFVAPHSKLGALSAVGRANMEALIACTSSERVHLRNLTANKTSPDEVLVTSTVLLPNMALKVDGCWGARALTPNR